MPQPHRAHNSVDIERRRLLRYGGTALGIAAAMPLLGACQPVPEPEAETEMLLPEGFEARVVARSGSAPAQPSDYVWHPAPDGGGCFAAPDGGWVYVSNSETVPGGVGALRFDANATLIDAYPILSGTRDNCAGGVTPWGTWLSCEEVHDGRVWECDPLGYEPARVRPALGVFKHEAACVDPGTGQIYLTEDRGDGRFYRYTPPKPAADTIPDLDNGVLETARVMPDGHVVWAPLDDPLAGQKSTREQARDSTAFDGGEGIYLHQGRVYFATKGDNRIWRYDTLTEHLAPLHDANGCVRYLDNLLVTAQGTILACEDGKQMRIALFPRDGGDCRVLLQVLHHPDSEIAGIAFDPGYTRLYFSSQRGSTGHDRHGVTYEVSGPFEGLPGPGPLVRRSVG